MTSTNSQHAAAKALDTSLTLTGRIPQGAPQGTLNQTEYDRKCKELAANTREFPNLSKK